VEYAAVWFGEMEPRFARYQLLSSSLSLLRVQGPGKDCPEGFSGFSETLQANDKCTPLATGDELVFQQVDAVHPELRTALLNAP
jgi:hypothetical protein